MVGVRHVENEYGGKQHVLTKGKQLI